MLFGIFLGLAFISLVVALFLKNKVVMVASAVAILLTIIIPVVMYSSSIGTIADLEAFYNASSTNFQLSRDDTASYLSEEKVASSSALIPIYGSLERMGVGQSAASRVLEYRNAVNEYNSAFARYKAYRQSLLFGIAYPDIPQQMRFLVVNPVNNGSPNNYSGPSGLQPTTPGTGMVPEPNKVK